MKCMGKYKIPSDLDKAHRIKEHELYIWRNKFRLNEIFGQQVEEAY